MTHCVDVGLEPAAVVSENIPQLTIINLDGTKKVQPVLMDCLKRMLREKERSEINASMFMSE